MMTNAMPRFQVHSWPLPSSTNYISSLLHHTVELVITTHITYQGCILTLVSIRPVSVGISYHCFQPIQILETV
jgi:hypothetical protein